jgi:hypothetical protein
MMPVALVLLIVLAVGLWTRPVRVQESRGARWEYCSVGPGAGGEKNRSVSRIVYFSRDAVFKTESVDGSNPMESLRRAAAKLGADGWEMVGVVGDVPIAYFKRPLP